MKYFSFPQRPLFLCQNRTENIDRCAVHLNRFYPISVFCDSPFMIHIRPSFHVILCDAIFGFSYNLSSFHKKGGIFCPSAFSAILFFRDVFSDYVKHPLIYKLITFTKEASSGCGIKEIPKKKNHKNSSPVFLSILHYSASSLGLFLKIHTSRTFLLDISSILLRRIGYNPNLFLS